MFHPEDRARQLIDDKARTAGWLAQSRSEINLGAGAGVAVREQATESGPADYGLYVARQLCGFIEAKPDGTTLSGFSDQAAWYITEAPKKLEGEKGQVRFEYVASPSEMIFCDHADPDPASRHVYGFHQPATVSAG